MMPARTEFQVQKGIEIPERGPLSRSCIYPWNKMEIGDSFFLPNYKISQVSSGACAAGKRYGKMYITRTLIENDIKGVRVWRVK